MPDPEEKQGSVNDVNQRWKWKAR